MQFKLRYCKETEPVCIAVDSALVAFEQLLISPLGVAGRPSVLMISDRSLHSVASSMCTYIGGTHQGPL